MTSRRSAVAPALAILFLGLHLPFLPASLEDLDSFNFALGVRDFDVARHQPHPPGYPLYIAAGKLVNVVVADEAKALGLLSNVAGALGVLSLVALFSRLDTAWPRRWAVTAAVVTATSPLYWFTAARPLTDVPGLAAAVGVQACLLAAATSRGIIAASALVALATGIRSQVAWLTVPLLVWIAIRHRAPNRARFLAGAGAAFVAGAAAWAVPLVLVTGGPLAYWRALSAQGAEDLSGIQMLWTTPTPAALVSALYYAFVAPWALWQLALGVLVFAAGGVLALYRSQRAALLVLALAYGPYFVFDLAFQETFTSRYALPLVVPVAYLAMRTVSTFPSPGGMPVALGAAAVGLSVGAASVLSYSLMEAPGVRMLGDMRVTAALRRKPPLTPVLAMHRREDLDLRRPIEWLGPVMPAFSTRLPAPPKREWLEMVKYWNGGGRDPIWFVADPKRTDLALIEHAVGPGRQQGTYRWPLMHPALLGGVRPNEMDWHVFNVPGWYLGEGWALTPETAGVADEDRRGPGLAPIEGWIRRRSEAVTLMIGGRNLSDGGASARVRVTIDDRLVEEMSAPPGFFLRFVRLSENALMGGGDYARLAIAADQPRVLVEQFDAQSSGRMVFGFGEGWHEMEYNPATGRSWRWMSERGVMNVRAEGRGLRLSLAGETEGFDRPTRVTARVGARVVGQWSVGREFSVDAGIPGDVLAGGDQAVTIESDQYFVPAERSRRTADRRRLALRVFEARLNQTP